MSLLMSEMGACCPRALDHVHRSALIDINRAVVFRKNSLNPRMTIPWLTARDAEVKKSRSKQANVVGAKTGHVMTKIAEPHP